MSLFGALVYERWLDDNGKEECRSAEAADEISGFASLNSIRFAGKSKVNGESYSVN